MNLKDLSIDPTWTLFLDRDGVINHRLEGDYVKSWDEFEFLPGVLKAVEILSPLFLRILVVSNQQGIGKGIMTSADVEDIHRKMLCEIDKQNGDIDMVYFSPNLEEENSPMRKPNIGMAMLAKREFSRIDLSKSIMVGDSITDMEFGKNAGMTTVFIGKEDKALKSLVDFTFPDLLSFTISLTHNS